MKSVAFKTIPIEQIDTGNRLRSVDLEYVEFLSVSMLERGLANPITVSEKNSKGMYLLLAGKHRLEAAILLGWENISVIVDPEKDELHQRLVEIDENLFRRELSVMDRSVFLAKRQEIYEILYPETKAGVAGGLALHRKQTTNFSFAENIAKKMGVSRRNIQRSLRRSRKICPKVQQRLAGTWLADKGTELDALIGLDPKEQMAAVEVILDEDTPAKTISKALPIIRGEEVEEIDPEQQQLEKLKTLFSKSSDNVKEQFIAWQKELELV